MKKHLEVPEITRTSSKGQIVIPTDIRNRLKVKEGSVFAVSAKKDMIVLKKLDTKMTPDDIRTLKSLDEAWKEIERGEYKEYSVEDFFKEMSKWKR